MKILRYILLPITGLIGIYLAIKDAILGDSVADITTEVKKADLKLVKEVEEIKENASKSKTKADKIATDIKKIEEDTTNLDEDWDL